MKTIFGNKRTLTSISAIALSLVLMTGGTFAWLTVGDFENQRTDFGVLDVISTNIDPDDPGSFITRYNLQPGFSWSEDGSIQNVGSLDAVVEVTHGNVYYTRNLDGKTPLPAPVLADKSLYTLGYTPTGEVIGAKTWYVDGFYKLPAPDDARIIQHVVVFKGTYKDPVDGHEEVVPYDRHFLFMDAAGDRYTFTSKGAIVRNPDGTPVWDHQDSVGLVVTAELDLATHAKEMTNQWNAAYLDGFKVLATQSRYAQAHADTLGLTPLLFANIDWPDDPDEDDTNNHVNLNRANYISAYEYAVSHFNIQF